MIEVPTVKLNNGIVIPSIGIGPGGIGHVNKPVLLSPNSSLFVKMKRRIEQKLHYIVARRKFVDSMTYALKIGYRLIDWSFAYGSGVEIMEAIRRAGLQREDVFNVSSTKSCRDAFLRLGKQDCRIKSPIAKTWQLAETQECVSTVW